MLSERDYAVVASMCRTGMSLEVLKKSFPQFSAEDVEFVYKDISNEGDLDDEASDNINISCNCS